ncbi:hypothetical protein [Pseudofrankia inefficax]|uniref:hypothetical protein n=1 Tax=Pseudofrankia inefficax (strain DSM 45817 / CECT 9037 / DDB 130130 / EuI1c) TaxID=298654 RepID=UPI0012FE307E|nr:hypothetical protein [Pseudofrankia inefficax]
MAGRNPRRDQKIKKAFTIIQIEFRLLLDFCSAGPALLDGLPDDWLEAYLAWTSSDGRYDPSVVSATPRHTWKLQLRRNFRGVIAINVAVHQPVHRG